MSNVNSLKKLKMTNGKKMCLLCFLIALLPRLIFLKWAYPLNIPADEFSMYLPVAKILGWDWSSMIESPLYYGYGFILLLTPLFKWINDPVILYRTIVAIMAVAQALTAPIAYYIVKHFFKVERKIFVCLTSVACSYLVTQRAVYTYNEFIYVLLTWIIFLILMLLYKAQDDKKMKRIYSVFLALVISYAMTIHSRAVTFILALGVLVLLYYWLYRKHILSYASFIIVGGGGYVLCTWCKNRIVQAIFATVPDKVLNTSVSFSTSSITSDPKALTGWFDIIVGQVNSMVIMTGGIAIVFAVIGCIFIWKTLVRDKLLVETANLQENQPYVIAFVFFLAATGITILGQSFSWLPGVVETLDTGVQMDALRALVYTRYYGAYFGPVALAGMAYAFHNREKVQKLLNPALGIVIALQCFWLLCIVPYLVGVGEGSFPSFAFSFTKGWQDNTTLNSYWPAVTVVLLVMIIFCFLYKRGRINVAFGIFVCVLVYGYCYQAIDYEGYRGTGNYKGVDKTYEVLHEMEEDGTLPYTIYVQNSSAKVGGHATGYIYQFLFKDHKVIPEEPDENDKEAIFLTGEYYEYPQLLRAGYRCAQLEDGEFIYVKGEKIQKALEKCGITLHNRLEYKEKAVLNKYYSDYTKNRSKNQIESDGSQGFLFYDNKFRWGGGELITTLTLQLLEAKEDLVGTFELLKDNGADSFYGQDIYASDFDEEGKLRVEIPVSCVGDEILEQRMTVYEGSKIRVTGIEIEKDSLYDIGRNEAEQVSEVRDFIQTYEAEVSDEVYYVGKEDTCDYSTEYLEKVLGKKVVVINLEDFKSGGIGDQNAFIITEGQECLFDVAREYPVLTRTKDFTVYTANPRLEAEYYGDGKRNSGGKGINITYFQSQNNGVYNQNIPFRLKEGEYEITAELAVKDGADLSGIVLDISEFGVSFETADFRKSSEDPNIYVATAKISNDDGFGELRIGLHYTYKGTQYTPDIYIEKKN